MKYKNEFLIGLIAILFLIAGCQNSENEENTEDTDKTENEVTEEVETENSDNDTNAYEQTQKNSNYTIKTQIFDKEKSFYTAFSINRDEEQGRSFEDRLKSLLLNNDPSEQEILKTYTNLSLEESNLEINFNKAGNELSTTTAQSAFFYDALFGISDMYGVEEITFLNPDGKKDIIVAERGVDNPIVVKYERDFTRGYYTIYDKESEETFFLPGAELGEQVVNENDEPLSFPETIEAMGAINNEDAFYGSAIAEGIKVVDTSIKNGVASVQYEMDEDKVTADDRTVFEKAIQLAALDF